MAHDSYLSPFSTRYASKEMQYIFSPDKKFRTWRRLWIALAETEKELGLSQNGKPVITQEQIDELKAHAEDINYDDVHSLRIEAKQKLMEIWPASIGQASRISGVSPADISVLLVYLQAN